MLSRNAFFIRTTLLLATFSLNAQAAFPIKDGKILIDVSGDSGGGSGGNVTLNLSYADNAKKQIKLEGKAIYEGKIFPILEIVTASELKKISVNASGGDGYSGSDGRSGWDGNSGSDGSNGWNGSDGCPPGDGSSGSNGSDGTDGTNGGDGGDGGNGGYGGTVRITAAADQSELLLLAKANVDGGSGGSGGSAGRGGSGGRGGRGGSGGSGGNNTCTNDKGEFIGGPSGSSGSNGWDGRSGSDGRNGSRGSSGYDGGNGNLIFTTLEGAVSRDYPKPFQLEITGIKAIDQNDDTVLEPGEALYITELTITNTGPMPSPTGGSMVLAFGSNSTLVAQGQYTIAVPEVIPGGSAKVISLPKGQVTLKVPAKADLVGKETLASTKILINAISIESADSTGYSVHWPVNIMAALAKAGSLFDNPKSVNFTLTNVSTKDIGTTHPVDIEISWVSTEIPGKDVSVTLSDGKVITMEQPYSLFGLTVPAKSKLEIPVSVLVKNTIGQNTANGALKLTLKLKDLSSEIKEIVDTAATKFYLAIDLRPVAFNQPIDISRAGIQCKFKEGYSGGVDISKIEVAKNANSEEVRFRITRNGVFSDPVSPIMKTNAYDFADFYSLLRANSAKVALGFFNEIITQASDRLSPEWRMIPGSCRIKR